MKDWKEWFESYGNDLIALDLNENKHDVDEHQTVNEFVEAIEGRLISRLIDEGYIKPKSEKRKKKVVAEWFPGDFDTFWGNYPKPSSGRTEAVREWNKLQPDENLMLILFSRPSEYYANTEPQFMLDASRYLKRKKWLDEIIKVKPKLLAVPQANDTAAIDKFVTKHSLPKATTEKDYWEYRGVLVKYIEKKQLMKV